MWSERCLHLAISNSKGEGDGEENFVVLPLLNINWAKWGAHFLLGAVGSHRDVTTISRGKLISAGTLIALRDTSIPLIEERIELAKWSSATWLHLISGEATSDALWTVTEHNQHTLLQSRNSLVGHFHCHTQMYCSSYPCLLSFALPGQSWKLRRSSWSKRSLFSLCSLVITALRSRCKICVCVTGFTFSQILQQAPQQKTAILLCWWSDHLNLYQLKTISLIALFLLPYVS